MALMGCYRSLRLLTGQQGRFLSTSRKNRETVTVAEKVEKTETDCKVKKNWVSYGFDARDETMDQNAMHCTMFATITLCIVFGGFYWAYAPDFKLMNWAQREAFLEIRRREALGGPLIDPNLIDPEKVTLPSDEELGETEVII
ncbi:hypothetical protein R5R35_006770 [Gryllus longicercus]